MPISKRKSLTDTIDLNAIHWLRFKLNYLVKSKVSLYDAQVPAPFTPPLASAHRFRKSPARPALVSSRRVEAGPAPVLSEETENVS
jgi:hypothetical protein